MKRIALALATLSLIGSATVANAATMTVDGMTGEVVFSELPTALNPAGPIGLTVRSAAGLLNASGGVNIGDIFDVALAPNALAWSKFGGFGVGPLNAGAIVNVAGQTEQFLQSDLTFEISPAFGAAIVQGDVTVTPTIPEPASIAMAGLGLVGIASVVRRRRVA